MNTLIVLGGIAVVIVAALMGVATAVKQFYVVPAADEALVKTGGAKPVVSTGGGVWVVPIFHKVSRVSLQAIRIPINRVAEEALPTNDKLMAEIKGELFVQINPQDSHAILLAVQSLGTSDPSAMSRAVREKIDSMVTDALRTAAFKKTFLELNSQKKEFADEVVDLLQEDLAKLGLTLTAVSIPHIYQGRFTTDAGDVFAAEGRRNVAGTVEKNREETNRIERDAQIAIQRQDVDARKLELELEFDQTQREEEQKRQVAEFAAQQEAETRAYVLTQKQREAEARAAQERAIAESQIAETEKMETARIEMEKTIAIQQAAAGAATRIAEETALQARREAEISRQRTVETAEIAKEQALKVADEQRLRAIDEARITREIAIALKKEEEAAARGKQAVAEADQRASEEKIHTATAREEADRRKVVATIHAEEEARKDEIAADRDAYVETKRAESEKTAALQRAEAVAKDAVGRADAARARATGEADAVRIAAEAAAAELRIRADAELEAAAKQADAQIRLATAALEQGRALAESERLMVEARNSIDRDLVLQELAMEAIRVAPAVMHEVMAPVANVAHDVKILQVNGLGGDNGEVQGLPATILNTGLAAAGIAPFLKEAVRALTASPEVAAIANAVGQSAKEAVRTVAEQVVEIEAAK